MYLAVEYHDYGCSKRDSTHNLACLHSWPTLNLVRRSLSNCTLHMAESRHAFSTLVTNSEYREMEQHQIYDA
jgi:hypothetical protein